MTTLRTSAFDREPPGRRAFTLVELLLVCAILGILLGATVPAFRGSFRRGVLRRAAFDLRTTLELARTQAICRESACQVRIDTETGAIAIVGFAHPEALRADEVTEGSRVNAALPGRACVSSPTYPTASGRMVVTFYPDGSADDGLIQLWVKESDLEEDAHGSIAIRVDGQTGGVSLEDG